MAYLASIDLKTFHPEEVAGFTKLPNGKYTISFPNGDVVSVQPVPDPNNKLTPNNKIEHRPAGTAGDYEQCELDGSIAVYNPDGKKPLPYAYINGNR